MMFSKENKKNQGVVKSILLAYFVLVLHVALLAGIALLVFFFGGLVRYLFYIVLLGSVLLGVWGYWYLKQLRRQGRNLREALRSPAFLHRALEISFMGGMVSMRIGPPEQHNLIDAGPRPPVASLEDPEAIHLHNIEMLGHLLEQNLITPEEFSAAKRRYLGK